MSNNNNCLGTCVFFGLLIFVTSEFTTRTIEEDNAQQFFSETVQGNIAELPCNITPPTIEDRVSLVIWYKNGLVSPIYSFDARIVEKGSHWSDKDTLKDRGVFTQHNELAMLTIDTTKSSDAGVYRCRVDFLKSPTRISKVNLTVIIPPENVLILDDKGSHIPHYILGPYNEGGSVDLTCVSTGGRPLPRLTWWHENAILDDSYSTLGEKKMKNVLHLEKLQRHHLHAVLTCQASNNNVTTPISSAVTLDMNLRPLWVKLQGENKPLSAGHTYELFCEVVGSRPKPTITWWKGSIEMLNTTETTSPEGNTTISVLTFAPTIADGGKFLSCRGAQSLIPDSGLESGWKLDIHHVPVVSLELGSNLNSTTIREGADVYFECNIKSNPWVYKVNWRHNGKHLYNNGLSGIIVANQSLVLQNVSRSRSGTYSCIGINKEGDGESNHVHLDVKFSPICRPGQILNYGVARRETAKIVCELEANPHEVNFTWRFNLSATELLDLPISSITVDRAKSVAHYTPVTEQDYGTLLCWGNNEIGTQSEPCIFNINPAGRPDPPSNCTVLNQTSDALLLECLEGFDGGLPQEFSVQVFSARTKLLIASQTSKTPFFELKGLQPEIGYDIVLTAVNKKGQSDLTIHHIYTLNNAEKHTDFILPYSGSMLHLKLFLGAIAGLLFGVLLITVATLVIMKILRGKHRNETLQESGALASGQSIQTNDGCAIRESCSGSTDSLEKNPDIIPQAKDDPAYDEEKALQWLNSMHSRNYATLTLSGQRGINLGINNQNTQNTYKLHEHSDFIEQRAGVLLHQLGSNESQNIKDLAYAELSIEIPKQKAIYTSATLGRPRHKDVRLYNEPTIYAQIDLAHNPLTSDGKMISYNDTTVTWIPASQAQVLRQIQLNESRIPPIICTRESTTLSQLPLDHRNQQITQNTNTTGQLARF